jgi:hypothetical protein
MKRLLIVTVCAVMLLGGATPAFAHFSGINLLSQSHEIWGGTFFNGVLDEYHITGSEPIEGRSIGAASKAGNYSVSADAFGDDSTNTRGAYACSTYVFKTEKSDLNIKLDGLIWFTIPETSVTYQLTDFTAGNTLDSFSYSSNSGTSLPRDDQSNSFFSYNNTLTSLDTDHVYTMYLCSQASTGDGGTAVLNARLSTAVPVPVPSALALGAMGTLITGYLRRRKRLC